MSKTHDYRRDNHGKGHACSWRAPVDGMKLQANGWGPRGDDPIEVGDYLLLSQPDGPADDDVRYRVTSIRYMQNPRDQWFADLAYAPRPLKTSSNGDQTP